jgi:hypothetical protein
MTKDEIARQFPEAVEFARQMREVFGDGVRLLYARNAAGLELGKQTAGISVTLGSSKPAGIIQSASGHN